MSEDPHQLPRHTTPTWEVELLISGVAVFAMLQLPGWLDDRYFSLLPRFDAGWRTPLFMTYVYLKGAAVILAITFALHLLLRAQWIAQVGMHSVFPEGIRWDRLRIGPLMREIEKRRYGNAGASIERADNRATVVFSIGVMLASSLLLLGFAIPVFFAIAMAAFSLLGIAVNPSSVFTACLVLLFLPAVLAQRIDRAIGQRLHGESFPHRLLYGVLDTYSRIGLMSRSSNPVFSLLASHGGELRAIVFTVAVVVATMVGVAISMKTLQDPVALGGYAAFPAFPDGSRTIDASHYDDQRDAAHDAPTSYIQSATATGAYVRLTVPYDPQRDTAAMRGCPIPAGSGEDANAARLDCLQSLHGVALDGKPLPGLQYEIGSDPRTDRPALVAMIDVRGLPRGRHELQIAYPPRNGRADNTKPGFDRIPFWR